MLVLSRRRNERVMIGDDIIVTIVETRGDKVRVGISAPKQVIVHREEVYEAVRKTKESEAASKIDLPADGTESGGRV